VLGDSRQSLSLSAAQASATSTAVVQDTPVTRASPTPRVKRVQLCVIAPFGARLVGGEAFVEPPAFVPGDESEDPQPAAAKATTAATANPTAAAGAWRRRARPIARHPI
jgi:hypothetical protein